LLVMRPPHPAAGSPLTWLRTSPPTIAACTLRALLYGMAILALIVFAPGVEHVLIYQGF
jgi:hypothetical protein